jgi:hypothetical protein
VGTIGEILVGLLLVWAAFVGLLWLLRPKDTRVAELVRIVPDVLRLVRSLVLDRRVPLGPRTALVALLAWLVNPST